MSRLQRISYLFPSNHTDWYGYLSGLLQMVPGSDFSGSRITLAPSFPAGGLPVTSTNTGRVNLPRVLFFGPEDLRVQVGNLLLESGPPQGAVEPVSAVNVPEAHLAMPIQDVYLQFHEHLLGLDHTGVDLPPQRLPQEAWQRLVQRLAQSANLYTYPSGEPWRFVLPSNQGEYLRKIELGSGYREPKFELAYDGYAPLPGIQFHLRTELTREQVAARLPEPYGFQLPGAQTFRSVYVQHPWPGLLVRFDFGYRHLSGPTDWDTGEWLVKEGRRVERA